MNYKEIGYNGVDWSGLVPDREKWWVDVNIVMSVVFCEMLGIS